MTLRAPKNACAKPQLYFSLAMPSLILHAHTSCASFPCFPIFIALLCTEHDRAAPLTKPPHHTMTNTGERIQERDQELGALNWPQTDLQCRSKAQGSLFLPDTPSACFFPGDRCRYPPPHLTCTSATRLHSSQGPCILWISFCFSVLNSRPFTLLWPLWFVKSLEQKLSVSTWKVPEIPQVLLQINKQTAVHSMYIKPTM